MYTTDYQDGEPEISGSLIIARRKVFARLSIQPQPKEVIIYRSDGKESGRISTKFGGMLIWETYTKRHGTSYCKLLKDGKVIPCRTRY